MSNGTNRSPSRSAPAFRYASNIAFQALRCTLAVSVRTPSRSKRQARIRFGKPSAGSAAMRVAYPRWPVHRLALVADLHSDIAVLSPLLGIWAGQGAGDYPTIEPFRYSEEGGFTHVGKPFLSYSQRTRAAHDRRPMHAQT